MKQLLCTFAENESILIGEGADDFTIDNDWLYYKYNSGKVGRYNIKIGEEYEYKDETDQAWIYCINAEGGQLYALTAERKGGEKIFDGVGVIDKKTLTIKKVLACYEENGDRDWMIEKYAPVNGWLYYYYSTEESERLYRVKLDGSTKEPQLITTFQWIN